MYTRPVRRADLLPLLTLVLSCFPFIPTSVAFLFDVDDVRERGGGYR